MASLRTAVVVSVFAIGLTMVLIGWSMDNVFSKGAVGFHAGETDHNTSAIYVANIDGTTVNAPPSVSGHSMLFGAFFLSMTPLVAAIVTEMEKYHWHNREYMD